MHNLGITALLHIASTTPQAAFVSLVGVSIGTATRWAALVGTAWKLCAVAAR